MIKRFLKRIEETTSEAWIAILTYIDNKLDNHDKRLDRHRDKINELEKRVDDFEDNFNSTKAKVDADYELKKDMRKWVLNAIIIGIVGFILARLGLG